MMPHQNDPVACALEMARQMDRRRLTPAVAGILDDYDSLVGLLPERCDDKLTAQVDRLGARLYVLMGVLEGRFDLPPGCAGGRELIPPPPRSSPPRDTGAQGPADAPPAPRVDPPADVARPAPAPGGPPATPVDRAPLSSSRG